MIYRLIFLQVILLAAVGSPAFAQPRPNITAKAGITIGRTFVSWGDTVALKSRDILSRGARVATVQFSYDYTNTTSSATPHVFSNKVTSDGILVGAQTDLALGSNDTHTATFRGPLLVGKHKIMLALDHENDVTEKLETDNRFVVFVIVP